MPLYTFYDAVEHLADFAGMATLNATRRDCKRAVIQAMRELANVHDWSYYIKEHFIRTSAEYTTGTVEYDHTGGSSERLLTLTTGTWPSWAAQGKVLINATNPPYDVATRIDDTTVTLSVNSNPGADVAAGTTFSIYRDSYPLPTDFIKLRSSVIDSQNKYSIPYVSPGQWLNRTSVYNSPSEVYEFTIKASENYQGISEMVFSPAPSSAKEYVFLYQRQPRDLKILDETGTLSTAQGDATITGSSTSWSTKLVGSCIRISDSTTTPPTGIEGDYPYSMERILASFTSTASMEMDANSDTTRTSVKYRISDPIDVQPGVMLNALLRTAEKEFANFRVQDRKNDYNTIAMRAVLAAIEADNRAGASLLNGSLAGAGLTELILERGELAG